jgi:ERCC4-type nuclease
VTFHRTRRNANRLTSELDDVPGIGERTVQKLLKTFGSLERVRQAPTQELVDVLGKAAAAKLTAYFAENARSGESFRSPLLQIQPAPATAASGSHEQAKAEHVG